MAALKTHISLTVNDVNRSVAFYQAMFDAAPAKHKADYAKFDLEAPGLNLALNQRTTGAGVASWLKRWLPDSPDADKHLSHLGIQVDSTAAVNGAIARFKSAGLATFEEADTDCCYALQDKVWVTDPDGNRWEIFVVKVADTDPATTVAPVGCCG
ncbi:MAG: VOC family protein [Cyanobacteria bacterium J06626_23]